MAEAVQWPTTRFVPAKTNEQLDLQALHRVRSRLVSERTAVINQICGFLLERGIIVRQGLRFLRQALPDILAKRTDVLSPRMVRIVADLACDWRQLDERIEPVTDEIETLAKSDSSCRRIMSCTAGAVYTWPICITGFPDRRSRPFRINVVITPAVHMRTNANLLCSLHPPYAAAASAGAR